MFGVWGSRKGEGGKRVGSRGVSLQATWDGGGRILSQLGGFQVSRRGPKGGAKGKDGRGSTKRNKSKGVRHVHLYIVIHVHVCNVTECLQ